MKIYVASSWKNLIQPGIVHALKRCGHEVYNFRHPAPGDNGFSWKQLGSEPPPWTPEHFRAVLGSTIANTAYAKDKRALDWCDACVLVLPAGRSAHWELGYAMGQGKRGMVVMLEPSEPELMYLEARIIVNMDELFDEFGEPRRVMAEAPE